MKTLPFKQQNPLTTKAKPETIDFLLNYSKSLHVIESQKHGFEVVLN